MELKKPPAPDLGAIVFPDDPAGDVDRYQEFLLRGAAAFNYSPVQSMLRPMFSGPCSLASVTIRCAKIASPVGRAQNLEVIQLVHPYAQQRIGHSRDLPRERYTVRKDVFVNVGPAVLYVEHQRPIISLLYARKTMQLREWEIAFWLRLAERAYLRGDYRKATLELLDLSAPNGRDRILRSYRSDQFSLPDDVKFDARLQRFADAYVALIKSGFAPPPRRTGRKQDGTDLFKG